MALGWLKDKVSDVAGSTWDAATEVADVVADTTGALATVPGDLIGAAGSTVNAATFGLAEDAMNVVDDTVLDGLDAATNGVIDLDFDDGQFTANAGFDDVLAVSAGVGADGVSTGFDLIDQHMDVELSDDGLALSGEAGVDWGPLPYASTDLQVAADGDVTLDTEAQGTFPTPYGLVSGSVDAEFAQDGDRWAGRVDADGSIRLTNGSIVRGGVDAAYAVTEDGSALSVGLEGSYTQPGIGTVGGAVGYERVEAGDVVMEGFRGEAYAEGLGGRVEAGASHMSIDTPDGSVSGWTTHVDATGPDLAQAGAFVGGVLGDAELGYQVGGMVDALTNSDRPPAGNTPAATSGPAHQPVPPPNGAAPVPSAGASTPAPAIVATAPSPAAAGAPVAATTPAAFESATATSNADLTPAAPAPAAATPIESAPVVEPPPAVDPAPPPDDFGAAVAAADGVEHSVDDMFDGLG